MKIAGVQFNPIFLDKKNNINKIENFINDIDADMIIFPELATSGYFFWDQKELVNVAEEFNGESISKFQNMAIEHNKIIVVGFAEKKHGYFYNSAAILLPDSTKSRVYRKTHLFYKEKFCFEPGESGFFVINDEQRDVRIGTMICYDWRFPEASRTLALMGADIIICPSNLVTSIWHKVMPARAIENKVYFAVINRIGSETRDNESLFFNGESAIYNYYGEQLAKAGIDDEVVIYAEIDPKMTRIKSFNEYNDVFLDRRPDMYKI